MSLTRNRRRTSAPLNTQQPVEAPPVERIMPRPRPRPVVEQAPQPVVRTVVRSKRAALLQSPAASEPVTSRVTPKDRTTGEPGNTLVVAKKTISTRSLPHWKQAERWFWLTHPETLERELVKPAGTTHVQGPFEMVQYTTHGGSLKACSVMFFETNSQPWNPSSGMR